MRGTLEGPARAAGAQGDRECEYCKSFIPVDASVCMFCTRDVEPLVA